jgi:hypothetical protein
MAKKKQNLTVQKPKYYDEEGNLVNFEEEQVQHYYALERQLKTSLVESAKILFEIKEKKYYLLSGYTDFKTYVNEALNYSYKTAQNYITVHQTFGSADYSSLPITTLVRMARDNDLMQRFTAKPTRETLKQLCLEFRTNNEAEKDVTETKQEYRPILHEYETMQNYRVDIQSFITYINTGTYLQDEMAVKILARINKELKEFWNEVEKVVMAKIEEINATEEEENKPIDAEIVTHAAKTENTGEKEITEEESEEETMVFDKRIFDIETFSVLEPNLKNKTIYLAIDKLQKCIANNYPEETLNDYKTFILQALPTENEVDQDSFEKSKRIQNLLIHEIDNKPYLFEELDNEYPIELYWR